MPKKLHLMVACAENRVMGVDQRLPWRIPEDTAYFHAATAGQTIVLGRICYETWPMSHRDSRRCVVVTSHPERVKPGAMAVPTLDAALQRAEALPGDAIYVNGGERIFAAVLALDRPMTLHLTLIHAEVAGDTYFPEWRHLAWRELARRDSADRNYRYTFLTLER
jgi:dihydrofolate reductase